MSGWHKTFVSNSPSGRGSRSQTVRGVNAAARNRCLSVKKSGAWARVALSRSVLLVMVARWSAAAIHEGQAEQAAPPDSPGRLPVVEGHPQSLKHRTRVTTEMNLPPTLTGTNAAPPRQKSFYWKTTWQGWNGLHTEVYEKTRIDDPLQGLRRDLGLTNSYRMFDLQELKTSGKIGAKLALDGAAYVTGKDLQNFADGVELRRARLYAKGDCLLLMPVSYWLEVGYVPNQLYLEKEYLAFPDIPYIGELRIGQFQAPMGLDMITSSRDDTFMEPASPLQALAPGVSAGVQFGRPVLRQRATWTAGFFTAGLNTDFGDATKSYGRAITRLTGLPIDQPASDQAGPAQLLHLGLSANLLYAGESSVHNRSRPESHLAPYVVDTGAIASSGALTLGTEVAWVNGPFSLQAECLHSFVDQLDGAALGFDGFYTTASWFLTGETRPYSRTEGAFSRVMPKHNFNWGKGGWGAWEIAGRYSLINLDSGDIHGGRLRMLSAGVNWYLHPHVKWRFDYGFGHVDGGPADGNINVFQTRMEVDF